MFEFLEQIRLAGRAFAEFSNALFDPTIRLGVTGLSRAGKTVFITALIHGADARRAFPGLRGAGRPAASPARS